MADKMMYIFNDDTQNYPFCSLGSVVDTFGLNLMNWPIKIQLKSPELLSQRLGKSSLPPSLGITIIFLRRLQSISNQ